MEIHMIEQKTYDVLTDHFDKFAEEIEALCTDSGVGDQWLDNQDVCVLLKISKRTLQYYRDCGKLPFSRIGNKCYYRVTDIEKLVSPKQIK